MDAPTWTVHAGMRAREKFADINLNAEYRRARPAGRRTKQRIRAQCPRSAQKRMRGEALERYYLVTRDWIVFVMAPPRTVVTVFQLRA